MSFNKSTAAAIALSSGMIGMFCASAGAATGAEYLNDSRSLYQQGQYFKSARYAFAAQEENTSLRPEAYSWITLGLIHANLPQAASYFFIRTLQTGDKSAIRRVLKETQGLLHHVSPDLLRRYLIQYSGYEDYDAVNRSAYLYALGKDALLAGDSQRALGYLNSVSKESELWPYALELKGAANAVLGNGESAIRDFKSCVDDAGDYVTPKYMDASRGPAAKREAQDLAARCQAGVARTLYQMDRFDDADRAYDRIQKASLVWPDILFEQAWNSFGKSEFNRSLGKLVSYKSPALAFVFNTEVDVLRAQTYLSLCLFTDANDVINEFNSKYTKIGEEVKEFVEGNSNDLNKFYDLGKLAVTSSLYSSNGFYRMANRFVRGPYFQGLVAADREAGNESVAVHQFDSRQSGVDHTPGGGFPGFLDQVLQWRLKTIRLFGGAFVKNGLIDYHTALIADFEKMAFIKLEMLKRAKDQLLFKRASSEDRGRGNVRPGRKDYQYYWSFNGEFWNDELGDYVFGLESECK